MADNSPTHKPDPVVTQPFGDPSPPVTPPKNKVVLRTWDHQTVFQMPPELDADGKPKGDPLRVDHLGSPPLSRKEADEITQLAARSGVELVELSEQKD